MTKRSPVRTAALFGTLALLLVAVVVVMMQSPPASSDEELGAQGGGANVTPELSTTRAEDSRPDHSDLVRSDTEADSQQAEPESASAVGKAWLDIQVIDAEDGDAAKQQPITIFDATGAWPWPQILEGSSDDDGKASFEVPTNRVLVINVRPEPHLQVARERVKPLDPGERMELEMRLFPHPVAHGRIVVVDQAESPIAGAMVSAEEGSSFATQETDSDGVAIISDLSQLLGASFRVEADGYARGYGRIDDEDPEQRVILNAEARLAGTITDASGVPVADAEVIARADPQQFGGVYNSSDKIEWHTRSSADGLYSLAQLPTEQHLVIEVTAGDELAVKKTPKLVAGEQQFDIQLSTPPTLSGQVLDVAARGVAGVVVEAAPVIQLGTDPNYSRALKAVVKLSATTDSEGRFHFDESAEMFPGLWRVGLAGSLDANIRPSADEGATYRWLPAVVEIKIPPGQKDNEVILQVESGPYISGVLVDEAGEPLEFGVVRVYPMSNFHGSRLQTTAIGEDGSFTIGPLKPGEYRIHAQEPVRILNGKAENVPAGTTDLLLVCTQPSGVKGKVVDAAGNPIQATLFAYDRRDQDSVMWSLRVNGDGEFGLFDDEVMVFDFFALLNDGRAGLASGVRLTKGGVTEVEIEMEQAVSLRIQVHGVDEERMYAVMEHRGQVIFHGNPWCLENITWLPEGQLHIEIHDRSGVVASLDELLLVSPDTVSLELRVAE